LVFMSTWQWSPLFFYKWVSLSETLAYLTVMLLEVNHFP
jgi:hypothetical protein